MTFDSLSDLLTRLRNATMAGKEKIDVQASRPALAVLKILESEGYVTSTKPNDRTLEVCLNFNHPISHIKRLSKPGSRLYVKSNEIPRPRTGVGFVILTTPKGVLTGSQARKQKVGGELICEVW